MFSRCRFLTTGVCQGIAFLPELMWKLSVPTLVMPGWMLGWRWQPCGCHRHSFIETFQSLADEIPVLPSILLTSIRIYQIFFPGRGWKISSRLVNAPSLRQQSHALTGRATATSLTRHDACLEADRWRLKIIGSIIIIGTGAVSQRGHVSVDADGVGKSRRPCRDIEKTIVWEYCRPSLLLPLTQVTQTLKALCREFNNTNLLDSQMNDISGCRIYAAFILYIGAHATRPSEQTASRESLCFTVISRWTFLSNCSNRSS